MERSCERALALGLAAVAFTDHVDRTAIATRDFDPHGYQEELQRCRRRFPRLRILSGVELGEPHRFPGETAGLLAAGQFDWVLGAIHCVSVEGRLEDLSEPGGKLGLQPQATVRDYLDEVLALLGSPAPITSLAHLEYPKRYWPPEWPPYRSQDYRDRILAVLEAAARRGLTLEINTTTGAAGEAGLCPAPEVVRWWREAGGRSVCLGSDAHRPDQVGGGLALAQEVALAAGFTAPGSVLGILRPAPAGPS